MIISASRRTDIPTYYSEWFLNRVREGYVYVRNPMNAHQISKISLLPEAVDGIVFWTKNPVPMLEKLSALNDYAYYFQFTLNSYGADVERNLPSKETVVIPAFQRLSDMIGPERVIWRYDPIFLSKIYTAEHHIRSFEKLAKRLSPFTKRCTISFLDFYRNTKSNMASLAPRDFPAVEQERIAKAITAIAHSYGLRVDTCAEGIELERYGIERARCIDGRLLSQLLGYPLNAKKDRNQRPACGCMESIDIGAYNTCRNGCRYCYANHSDTAVRASGENHDPAAPLLMGTVGINDKITERKMLSCRIS